MSTAPKFYRTAKPVVRDQAALDRHCEALADDLKALSAKLRRERAKAKAAEQAQTESPDENEREAEA